MTIQQLHYDFKFKLDKVDSLSREDFNPAEIDWLLNEAIWVWVKNKYGKTNIYREGFETSQKRIDDLRSLHIVYPIQPSLTATRVNNYLFELPLSKLEYEYLFLTRLKADIMIDGCTKQAQELILVQSDDLNDVLRDPFNKPSFNYGVLGYRLAAANTFISTSQNPNKGSIYLYTDGTFSVTEVYPEYLKYPNRVWVGTYDLTSNLLPYDGDNSYIYQTGADAPVECDLEAEAHPEIVDLAVSIAAGIIENPAYVRLKQEKLMTNE
jgi:hypothetical protein